MEVGKKIIFKEPTPDHARIKRLVEAAAEHVGGFAKLAKILDSSPQLISNWRNGVRTPSPEAQADMAQIAKQNVFTTSLMALIEKTTGDRRARLQASFRDWMKDKSPDQGAWRNT